MNRRPGTRPYRCRAQLYDGNTERERGRGRERIWVHERLIEREREYECEREGGLVSGKTRVCVGARLGDEMKPSKGEGGMYVREYACTYPRDFPVLVYTRMCMRISGMGLRMDARGGMHVPPNVTGCRISHHISTCAYV